MKLRPLPPISLPSYPPPCRYVRGDGRYRVSSRVLDEDALLQQMLQLDAVEIRVVLGAAATLLDVGLRVLRGADTLFENERFDALVGAHGGAAPLVGEMEAELSARLDAPDDDDSAYVTVVRRSPHAMAATHALELKICSPRTDPAFVVFVAREAWV